MRLFYLFIVLVQYIKHTAVKVVVLFKRHDIRVFTSVDDTL